MSRKENPEYTNQEHTSSGRHKIFNKWETHIM